MKTYKIHASSLLESVLSLSKFNLYNFYNYTVVVIAQTSAGEAEPSRFTFTTPYAGGKKYFHNLKKTAMIDRGKLYYWFFCIKQATDDIGWILWFPEKKKFAKI